MIKVDKEFEKLIPPLSPEEFAQLEENCVRDGIRDPLVVWHTPEGDDILIDGHNRWKISAKHSGIRFDIKCMEFESRDDAKAWMLANQLGRRNLNTYNRSLLALELKPLIQKKAKANQKAGTSVQPETKVNTGSELARVANVGRSTLAKVEVIERDGSDYVKEKVRSGDMTINKAYLETKGIRDKSPAQMKKEFMDRVKQEHETFAESKTVTLDDVRADQENRKTIANDVYSQLWKAGRGIGEFYIGYTSGAVNLKEAIADWSLAQKDGMRHHIHTWMQELNTIKEEIV